MNKPELIAKVSEKAELNKRDTERFLKAFIESVEETVASGEKVQLIGFGTFERRERAERKGRNPQTKEEIIIPATKSPAFKAGGDFKKLVKENK